MAKVQKSKRPEVSVYRAVHILHDAVGVWVGLQGSVEIAVERLATPGLTVEHARAIGESLAAALARYKETATSQDQDAD